MGSPIGYVGIRQRSPMKVPKIPLKPTVLLAKSKGRKNWDYEVYRRDHLIASFDIDRFTRPAGFVTIDNKRYGLEHERGIFGLATPFELQLDETVLYKIDSLDRFFYHKDYALVADPYLKLYEMDNYVEHHHIGSIRSIDRFRTTIEIDLPNTFPIELKMLIFWATIAYGPHKYSYE